MPAKVMAVVKTSISNDGGFNGAGSLYTKDAGGGGDGGDVYRGTADDGRVLTAIVAEHF